MQKEKLKEIIIANKEFLKKEMPNIVERENVFLPADKLNKVVILYGARRSGKTFVLFDLFKKYPEQSLYIDFEDERLSNFTVEDFETLKEAFDELSPHLLEKKKYFFLDEIQNVKGWEKFCRRAVEKENISVFVAGSSSKILPLEIHTSLRGRAWSIEISPFSFREYLKTKGIPLNEEYLYGHKKAMLKEYFATYMKWGGFPEVALLEKDFDKRKLLNEYMGAMFFKDLVERFHMDNAALLENLEDKLFSSFALKFSLNAFYKQYKSIFSFSKDSLYEYYKNFIKSMLVFETKILAESIYKRQRNPAKIYLVDPGLSRKTSSEDRGRTLENIVFLKLRKAADSVFYFSGKAECDFVAKMGDGFHPFQVCFELNDKNKEREISGLLECCNALNKKEGILLSYDQEETLKSNGLNIRIIPVWKWLPAKIATTQYPE